MKIKLIGAILFITLCLTACGNYDNTLGDEDGNIDGFIHPSEILEDKENDMDVLTKYQEIILPGQKGTMGIQIPEDWDSISFPEFSECKIRFYPEDIERGYIELAYMESFGVCGTGLTEKEITIAGDTANMGTYDNQEYWDFIVFKGKNQGIVASTFEVDEGWEDYTTQVMEILNTVSMQVGEIGDTEIVNYDDSKLEEIGLSINVGKFTRTCAELYFVQSDGNPKGDLQYGDDFIIERIENDVWIEAPIVVEGDYGFNAIAYQIAKEDATSFEIDWKWLYGELESGEYRIGKSVLDFIKTGIYDEYMIYVYFTIK